MLVMLIRTAILYLAVIIGLRIMGKRQIGDMQPNELVITILVSEIASLPIQDSAQPMINGLTSVALLVALEVILSVLAMKSGSIRRMVNGGPVIVIRQGQIDQKAMESLRITMDDLLASLRQNQIFDVTEVEYAIVETNGSVSVMLTPENCPITNSEAGKQIKDKGLPTPVVCDGKIQRRFIDAMNIKPQRVQGIIASRKLKKSQIFLMTLDSKGNTQIIEKEQNK